MAVLLIPSLVGLVLTQTITSMYAYLGRKYLKDAFRAFAHQNHFSFNDKAKTLLLTTSGKDKDIIIDIENLTVAMKLEASFPEVFLAHRTIPMIHLPSSQNSPKRVAVWDFNMSQRFELEGDFAREFDVFAPNATAPSVLSLLNPALMETVLLQPCSIYVKEHQVVYGLSRKTLYNPDWLKHFQYIILTALEIQPLFSNVTNFHSAHSVSVPWKLEGYAKAPSFGGYQKFVAYSSRLLLVGLPLYLWWYDNSLTSQPTYGEAGWVLFIGVLVAIPAFYIYRFLVKSVGGRIYSYWANLLSGRLR